MKSIVCEIDPMAYITISEVDAKEAIDRTVSTINKELNEKIWNFAGYKKLPTVEEMIKRLIND